MAKQKALQGRQPGLAVEQIFLVSAIFGHRKDFLSLPPNTEVKDLEIKVGTNLLAKNDGTAAALSITVATDPEDQSALYQFRVELMALIRTVPGEENMSPLAFMAGAGFSTLFPFVRESVANLTMRGRFGPVWLKPINVQLAVEGLEKSQGKSSKTTPRPSKQGKEN